jgi:hypothetical protein
MDKVGRLSLFRTFLAVAAVLIVAIPSFVSAAGPAASYPAPRLARIVGPASVAPGNIGSYQLYVTFVDGSTAVLNAPPVVFSVPANEGTFTGDNLLVNNAYTGSWVLVTGKFSSNGYSVTANRTISTK